MILTDFNQVAIANIMQFSGDLKKNQDNKSITNIARHAILSSLKFYKAKFQKEFGSEMVIACDSNNYWRKDIFPYYKASRSKQRAKSDLDWRAIFDALDLVREELKETFPYHVLRIPRVEADDIIAVLTQWAYTNKVKSTPLFDEPEPILIISSDKDHNQLHTYSNVRQWCPNKKSYLQADLNILNEHIARGDSSDGICNVLSDDDTLVTEGKRQNRMTAKRLEEFREKGREACQNDYERRNWDRNNHLINYNMIPDNIAESVVKAYQDSHPERDLNSIMQFLMYHNCAQLLDSIEDF